MNISQKQPESLSCIDTFWIGGNFLDVEIPKKYEFLTKYFTTDTQKYFLKYFWVFRSWESFVDHTGILCSERYLRKQAALFSKLLKVFDDAFGKLDTANMETIHLLSSGKYKV